MTIVIAVCYLADDGRHRSRRGRRSTQSKASSPATNWGSSHRFDNHKERTMTHDSKPNIVLAHGAWADGSNWSTVIERLQADGYHVTAPQFPLTSLADDVAKLRRVLALQDGPTVVAGHSYGGQVMTALGTEAPNVVGLVYIAAFGIDQGESLGGLLSQGPPPRHSSTNSSTTKASSG
jgi:pimeloyl-ACP methyl ester carboxylesterase